MSWESDVLALWDDLEQQAEGLALRQRDAEVAELARAEYAEVGLADRLHASVGRRVELELAGTGRVRGRLAQVGAGWVLVEEAPSGRERATEWVVTTGGLLAVRGLADRATAEPSRPLTGRLGLGSVLRRLAARGEPVLLVRVDGERRRGTLGRVGADFSELRSGDGHVEVVPLLAVAALRSS